MTVKLHHVFTGKGRRAGKGNRHALIDGLPVLIKKGTEAKFPGTQRPAEQLSR